MTHITIGNFGAFMTSENDGFYIMLERYNIFKYLLSRSDIGKSIIEAYKDAGIAGFKTLPYSNDFWPIKMYYLELLLSQKEILQSLSDEEKFDLLVTAREKLSEKANSKTFESIPSFCYSVRIMACILNENGNFELSAFSNRQMITRFINVGGVFDTHLIEEIIDIVDNYIDR